MSDSKRRAPKFPLRLDQMAAPHKTLVKTPAASPPPTGLGLDSAGVRQRMVERLRGEGLRHEAVLAAMGEVPRHRFVDAALVTQAYESSRA